MVVQGGNTGLAGGSVGVGKFHQNENCNGVNGELILNMGRMNSIINIDQSAAVLMCEAGCILETLNNEVASHGLLVPLDLGAKGSWFHFLLFDGDLCYCLLQHDRWKCGDQCRWVASR